MTAKPFNQASALQIIGNTCKKFDIPLAGLRAAFPQRPTNEAEFMAIAEWMQGVWEARKAQPTPSSPQAKPDAYGVPAGNYAFEYNGKTHFYRVSKKEGKGKWAGRTFTKVQERASDDLFEVDRKRAYAILCRIVELTPAVCGKTFADKLGCCYNCNKSLTDENNPYKPYGLGPDCGPKVMG